MRLHGIARRFDVQLVEATSGGASDTWSGPSDHCGLRVAAALDEERRRLVRSAAQRNLRPVAAMLLTLGFAAAGAKHTSSDFTTLCAGPPAPPPPTRESGSVAPVSIRCVLTAVTFRRV